MRVKLGHLPAWTEARRRLAEIGRGLHEADGDHVDAERHAEAQIVGAKLHQLPAGPETGQRERQLRVTQQDEL